MAERMKREELSDQVRPTDFALARCADCSRDSRAKVIFVGHRDRRPPAIWSPPKFRFLGVGTAKAAQRPPAARALPFVLLARLAAMHALTEQLSAQPDDEKGPARLSIVMRARHLVAGDGLIHVSHCNPAEREIDDCVITSPYRGRDSQSCIVVIVVARQP